MTLSVQLYTIFSMIGMGVYLGAALDTYHRFLKRHRRKRISTILWDILFWFSNSLLFFWVLLNVNKAELRIYIFFAILCGYATYQSLLRLLYLKVLEGIIQLLIRTYHFLYTCIRVLFMLPILWVFNILWAIALFFWRSIYRIIIWGISTVLGIVKGMGLFLWRYIPKKGQQLFLKYAGYFQYTKKINNVIQKWRKKFK